MLRGIFAIIFLIPALSVLASPEKDFDKFVSYFKDRFPNTPYEDYKNGVYSIDASAREQWEAMEEFPPYELNVDRGEELFNQAFKNGNTYGSCFQNEGIGISFEPAAAITEALKRAKGKPKDYIICATCCGRVEKDLDVIEKLIGKDFE